MGTKPSKVGALDDPIWGEVDPTGERQSHQRRPPSTRRDRRPTTRALAITVAIAVALVISLVTLRARNHHPGGDPGNVVLRSLELIKTAVPSGASAVRVHVNGVQWVGVCPDLESEAGWLPALVTITFIDSGPRATVVSHIDSVLGSFGWQRKDTTTPQKGLIPHWTIRERSGSAGNAFAYPTPVGSPDWFMTATWQPPGPVARTCP